MKLKNIAISAVTAGVMLTACNQKPQVDETVLNKMVEERVMNAIDAKEKEWNAKVEAAAQLKAADEIAKLPQPKVALTATAKPAPAKPKTPAKPKSATTTTTSSTTTTTPAPTPSKPSDPPKSSTDRPGLNNNNPTPAPKNANDRPGLNK